MGYIRFPFHRTRTNSLKSIQPFRDYDFNSSGLVRDGLPSQIIRKDKSPINILKYPHDVNCVYDEVLAVGTKLWSGRRSVYELGSKSEKRVDVDLMIHLGMHPDEEGFFVEKRARVCHLRFRFAWMLP